MKKEEMQSATTYAHTVHDTYYNQDVEDAIIGRGGRGVHQYAMHLFECRFQYVLYTAIPCFGCCLEQEEIHFFVLEETRKPSYSVNTGLNTRNILNIQYPMDGQRWQNTT